MGLADTIFGKPPSQTFIQTPGVRPPGYDFAKNFFNFLGSLTNTPYPTYQGQVDPGLSPTMQDLLRRSQGYAASSMPEILQGVQGSIGRFMSPSFLNPANALFGSFGGQANYFGADPAQRLFGGQPAGGFTWNAGMQPPWSPPQPQGTPAFPVPPFGGG